MRRWLCKIGLHRPMAYIRSLFTDVVVGRTVCEWECSCGIRWMAFRGFDWGFRIQRAPESPVQGKEGPHG